jgi:hypothetical protein
MPDVAEHRYLKYETRDKECQKLYFKQTASVSHGVRKVVAALTAASADVSAPGNGLQCAASDLLAAAEECTRFQAHLLGPMSWLQQLLPCCCHPSVLSCPGVASAVSWVCCLTSSACLMV